MFTAKKSERDCHCALRKNWTRLRRLFLNLGIGVGDITRAPKKGSLVSFLQTLYGLQRVGALANCKTNPTNPSGYNLEEQCWRDDRALKNR